MEGLSQNDEFDRHFMRMALREAEKAAADGEVPTGCVIVEPAPSGDGGFDPDPASARILARAHNQPEMLCDATAHAEMLALTAASSAKGAWRLSGTRLYVTKEPCPMCAGAIILARVPTVVWGVSDPKRGGGTVFNIFGHPGINHHPEIVTGVMEEESLFLLRNFFRCRRCGACCRIKDGIVRVSDGEIARIAAFLGMKAGDFIASETELAPDRKSLILKSRADGSCAYLSDDGLCRINPVKPDKCRTFPQKWTNPDSAAICPGLQC